MKLSGSHVVVTGASAGIGEATATMFAAAGGKVTLISEDKAGLERVMASILQKGGIVQFFLADFGVPAEISGLIAKAETSFGPVDILVNNAGIGLHERFARMDDERLRKLFEINLFGMINITQQAILSMRPRHCGTIFFMSSASGRFGSPGITAYSASKGAMHTLTQGLRCELWHTGIKVSEVIPISVKTAFFDKTQGSKYDSVGVMLTPEQVGKSVVKAARRRRTPAEVYPFWPVKFVFLFEDMFPGFLARFVAPKEEDL